MRVAYICADPGVPVFGKKGCTVHVQEVIRALRQLGGHVELFATRFDEEPTSDLTSLRVHRLPPAPKGEVAEREQKCLAMNQELRLLLEDNGPFDLVYERYSLWSYVGMEYSRDHDTPGVLEVNAPLIEEQAQHRILVDRPSAESVAERALGAASVIAAVSDEMAKYLERYPSAKGKVHVVANGVNPQRFLSGTPPLLPAANGVFTVGFLGNLKPWHGAPELIEAFDILHRRDSKTRLLIVGDGDERDNIAAMIEERGLKDAVILTGKVAADQVSGMLASMDVGVAPYPDQPNFYFSPLKAYEYMAAGLPVVASRIGQLGHAIEDGVTGFLCPSGDVAVLASTLERLKKEPELCRQVGQAARCHVLSCHTWQAVVERLLHLAGLGEKAHTPPSKDVV